MASKPPPAFDEDLYGDELLLDPCGAYHAIRELGSAVWLSQHNMWAVGRFDDVRTALKADTALISGRGVAANEALNARQAPITLTSDGDVHLRRRNVMIQPLLPASLKTLRTDIETEAGRLVEQLATGEKFEAVSRFASHLPISIVAELVGLDDGGRANMLGWASATFNALGVMNDRGMASMPTLLDLRGYVQSLDRTGMKPGAWAARLFEAAERGEISPDEAKAMVIDYVVPALDTTILATAHMLWLLATAPAAYDALRVEPGLVPSVVNEAVRLASPIRSFTRFAVDDIQVGDAIIPKGSRALVLFASANRDERHYSDPDSFDIRRNPRDHVGWGHGAHVCAGMHLARLEMEALLTALVQHVGRITIGKPVCIKNNVLQGFERLPAAFHPV